MTSTRGRSYPADDWGDIIPPYQCVDADGEPICSRAAITGRRGPGDLGEPLQPGHAAQAAVARPDHADLRVRRAVGGRVHRPLRLRQSEQRRCHASRERELLLARGSERPEPADDVSSQVRTRRRQGPVHGELDHVAPDGQDCIRRPGVDTLQGLDHGGQAPRPEHGSRQVRPQDRRRRQGVRSRRRGHDRLCRRRRRTAHGERGGRRRDEAHRLPDLDHVHGGGSDVSRDGTSIDVSVARGGAVVCTDHERSARASHIRSRSRPMLECVLFNDGQPDVAYWGYKNPNEYAVTIPFGDLNKFSPGKADRASRRSSSGGPRRCVPHALRRLGRQPRLVAVREDRDRRSKARRPATRRSSSARSPMPADDPGVFQLRDQQHGGCDRGQRDDERAAADGHRRGQRERDRGRRNEPRRLRLQGRVHTERNSRDLGRPARRSTARWHRETSSSARSRTRGKARRRNRRRRPRPPTATDAAQPAAGAT